MLFLVVTLCLSYSTLLVDSVALEHHVVPENLRDYLLEEVLHETLINHMTSMQEDYAIMGTILDPVLEDNDIAFELYTRDNIGEAFILKTGLLDILKDSPFNGNRPTKILVHGWTDSGNTFWLHDMRRNYLVVADYNIICVNWFPASTKEYLVAARLTRQVGTHLADLLRFLVTETDLTLDTVHIVGHSLGAHAAGSAGLALSGELGRITGLDPARPAFEVPRLKDPKDRLDPTDAKFVDVIHTCAGTLGFVRPIGDADFYPNGGSFRQPGCPVLSAQACSHDRSHQFMAESIVIPESFVATQCDTWTDFRYENCGSNITTAILGESITYNTRGIFFLETNPQSPFGKGRV